MKTRFPFFFHKALPFLNSTSMLYRFGETQEIGKFISAIVDLNSHEFVLLLLLTTATLFGNILYDLT